MRNRGHVCIDLGEDEFTQVRLHPMIDPTLRNRRILQAPATTIPRSSCSISCSATARILIPPARPWRRSARRSGWRLPQAGMWFSWHRFAEQRLIPSRSADRRRRSAQIYRAAGQRLGGAAGGVDHAGFARVNA